MNEVEENSINIRELFAMLRKRILLIVTMTVLATVIGGVYTFFIAKPIYQATAQLVVRPISGDEGTANAGAVSGNIQLINTINPIITSPKVIKQVKNQLNLTDSIRSLQGSISASNATNSLLINIVVKNEDKNLAKQIADKTAEIFSNDAPDLLSVKNVSRLGDATLDPSPVSPNKKLNLAISFVIGFLIGAGIALIREFMDNTINSEEDIEQILGKPLLGVVPLIEGGNSFGQGTTLAAKSSARNHASNRRRR
ncbi:MAG: polysaccharide biosynthesis protein [Streptococcaceae bacterium]|jgi:capsular polysaccharide biosynthesis protein|nr:polysaccharide biosynthesis protein [Streptococcaceae bacterium]